jgi:transitional endoplasmic reticulum ATPase
MDEATLRSLLEALVATPDNAALRIAVIRGLHGAGDARAAEYVGSLTPGAISASDRAVVAEVLLRAGAHGRALEFADGADPELQLVRARALHAQGEQAAALAAYEATVRANPTLEDRDLRALLAASIRVHTGDGPRLRVVSNDDTDRSEIDRLLHPTQPAIGFADVGGLDEIKTQIEKRIILPFQKPALFAKFKRKPGGGILLYGPPGWARRC